MQNSPRCVVLTPRTRRPASSPPGKQNAFKESRRLRESMDGSMGSFTQTILHFSPPRGGEKCKIVCVNDPIEPSIDSRSLLDSLKAFCFPGGEDAGRLV